MIWIERISAGKLNCIFQLVDGQSVENMLYDRLKFLSFHGSDAEQRMFQ